MRSAPLATAALALAVLTASGCGGSGGSTSLTTTGTPAPPPRTSKATDPAVQSNGGDMYVGRLDGTRALLGIASWHTRARAYVCDPRSRTAPSWLEGTRGAAAINLRANTGSGSLTATVSGGRARGSVDYAGRRRTFVAGPAQGDPGVYVVSGQLEGRQLAVGSAYVQTPGGAHCATTARLNTAARLAIVNHAVPFFAPGIRIAVLRLVFP